MLIPVKYNIRYLAKRWTMTLATGSVFAMVVAVFVIIMSLGQGIDRAFKTTGDPLNVIMLRPGAESEGQSSVQIDRYRIIREFRGIAKDEAGEPMVAPDVAVLVNKPKAEDGSPTNLQIRGVHPMAWKLRPKVRVVEGRNFNPGSRELIVSKSVSQRFADFKLGDKPRLGKGTWTVVGLFEAEGTAYESEVWTDYRELMEEFDRDAYNTVVMRAIDEVAAEALIALADEDNRVKLEGKTEFAYYAEQTRSADAIKAFGGFLAVMMSVGACFAGMNTMYATVANRTREIGTLRVLGFTPSSILTAFLLESIGLSIVGGAIGCLLSLPMNGLATGTTNFQTFSEVVFYFTITPRLLGMGMLFAMLMGIVGGFLPAVQAARSPILASLKRA